MARAEAASPSVAKRLSLSGFSFPRRAAISGHAKLLARPAYQKLLAAEPLLRRLIPVLIAIFLVIVGLARFVELYQLKVEREHDARARCRHDRRDRGSRLRQGRSRPGEAACRGTTSSTRLPTALPRRRHRRRPAHLRHRPHRHGHRHGAARHRRRGDPAHPHHRRGPAAHHLRRARRRARDRARRRQRALATVAQPRRRRSAPSRWSSRIAGVYDDWRSDVSLNVAIFIGTSAILLVILYGYFAQTTRAGEADRIYSRDAGALRDGADARPLRPVGLGPRHAGACSGRARCSRSSASSRATRCSASAR